MLQVTSRMALLQEVGRILRGGNVVGGVLHVPVAHRCAGGYVTLVEPDACYSRTLEAGSPPVMGRTDELIMRLPHSAGTAEADDDSGYGLPARPGWSMAPILGEMLARSRDGDGRELFCSVESKEYMLPIGEWGAGERCRCDAE